MRKNKRGISPIIATIMIVLLTIVAFSMISGIMIPMIKDWMKKGQTCYDAMGQLEVDASNANTCHKDGQTKVVVKRGLNEKADIASLTIALRVNGQYKTYEIVPGQTLSGVVMNTGQTLSLPTPGGGKVYIFDVNADYVMISGRSSTGKTCEDKSTEIVNICL